MLSDIEKRKQQDEQKKVNFLFDLVAPKNFQKIAESTQKHRKIIIIAVILFFIFLISITSIRLLSVKSKKAQTSSSAVVVEKPKETPPPATEKPNAQISVTPVVTTSSAQPVLQAAPPEEQIATLEKIVMEQEDNKVVITLSLSEYIHYDVDMDDAKSHAVLTLYDTKTSQILPDMEHFKTIIQSLKIATVDVDDLQFTLDLKPNAKIQSIHQGEDSKKLVIICTQASTIVPENPIVPSTSGAQEESHAVPSTSGIYLSNPQFNKQEIPLTPQQKSDVAYSKAMKLLANNQYEEGRESLINIMIQSPNYLPARKALIILLLQQRDYATASRLIDEGLKQDPDNLELIKLKARLLIIQQQLSAALKLLKDNAPAVSDDPEYFSIMAALQEQMGHPEIAAQLYQGLIDVNANQGEWWAGLGIALEKINQINDAVNAYQRALSIGNLNSNLQTFIEVRLHQLIGN